MRVLDHRALRGPNFFARFPVIYMVLDLGPLEEAPSDEVPGLPARIKEAVPSLATHECSPGVPGGFFQRLDGGTWAGHIVEHMAIELQCLAGMEVGYGKTRQLMSPGVYSVVYRYRDEPSGLLAGRLAVELLAALIEERPVDVAAMVDRLKATREENLLGPSTASIVAEADLRGIPHRRLNVHSHIMLGQGRLQRHIQASMTDGTTVFGVEAAADKSWTKRLLAEAGIAVPEGGPVDSLEAAREMVEEIGYPVAVKPLDGNHGRGITTGIDDDDGLEAACHAARVHHETVVVERHLLGEDHRLLMVGGALVAAARRDPAHVVGDGQNTIQQLIDALNEDPRRGYGHERSLTQVAVDQNTRRMLQLGGWRLDSVPPAGTRVVLKSTANLSTGGTATDVTDEVHPSIRFMAERVARIIDLDIMGIDIVAPHLHERLSETGGGIVEVNAGPGLRMHLDPTHGTPRDVAGPIVDLLFPDSDGRIPTIAVSGTNGKTTTARLIAHCLKYAGGQVGLATGDGVEVENETILSGDRSGPLGAQAVLREPSTTHAVLAASAEGILERGMGVDRVDVAIILNTRPERMGETDVHDEDDLLQLGSTVTDVADVAVLNIDDPLTLRIHETRSLRARRVLCTMDPDHPALGEHLDADPEHLAVVATGDAIEVWQGAARFHVADTIDVPITLAGKARFNIQNTLAAVAACHALRLPEQDVRAGITTFHASPGQNPGRLNLMDVGELRVLVDRGQNLHAIEELATLVPHLANRDDARVLRVAHIDDRPREELHAIGGALTAYSARLWLCGVTAETVREGAIEAGLAPDQVTTGHEPDQVAACLGAGRSGDLLIFQCKDHDALMEQIRQTQAVTP